VRAGGAAVVVAAIETIGALVLLALIAVGYWLNRKP
jgi:hypothetical protein